MSAKKIIKWYKGISSLNYRCLALMSDLQREARSLLESGERKKHSMFTNSHALQATLKQFADQSYVPHTTKEDRDNLLTKLSRQLDAGVGNIDLCHRLGYGGNSALEIQGSVAEKANSEFLRLFSDKGNVLRFEDVNTLEECVRFLHAQGIDHFSSFMRWELAEFTLIGGLAPTRQSFFDITYTNRKPTRKDLAIGEMLSKYFGNEKNYANCGSQRGASAVIDDSCVLVFVGAGKHYFEIMASMDKESEDYSLKIKFVDTEAGVTTRTPVLKGILERKGFARYDLSYGERVLLMSYSAIDRDEVVEKLDFLCRVAFSLNELDMHGGLNGHREVLDRIEFLLDRGATSIDRMMMYIKEAMHPKLQISPQASESDRRLVSEYLQRFHPGKAHSI